MSAHSSAFGGGLAECTGQPPVCCSNNDGAVHGVSLPTTWHATWEAVSIQTIHGGMCPPKQLS